MIGKHTKVCSCVREKREAAGSLVPACKCRLCLVFTEYLSGELKAFVIFALFLLAVDVRPNNNIDGSYLRMGHDTSCFFIMPNVFVSCLRRPG